MIKRFFPALTLALTCTGCSAFFGEDGAPTWADVRGDTALLTKHWVHSREEEPEAAGYALYRPADFKDFPISWFRMQYVFHPGGDCDWLYLAPNDAHYFREGTWRRDPIDRAVLHVDTGDRTDTFRILELTPDLLRLAPIRSVR